MVPNLVLGRLELPVAPNGSKTSITEETLGLILTSFGRRLAVVTVLTVPDAPVTVLVIASSVG